jgi:predicted porin
MNKISIAALSTLASLLTVGAAHAQSSVIVYGLLDVGIDNTSNATPGKSSLTRVTSGGQNTSRWGVRGSEDLGNGLKAVFNLEGGLSLDTGTIDGGSTQPLFKRQANVGFEGSFGRVVVGRSFTTVYDFMLPFDPMGYAPSYSWATSGNATTGALGSPSKYGMTTAFDNLIKYAGQAGPVKFGASYGFGEQASGSADSRKMAVAANYGVGPFALVATYEQVNGNTVALSGNRDKTTVAHLGAMYTEGPLKIQAAVRDYKLDSNAPTTPDLRGDLYWAGVSYETTPALTLTGVVYYQDVKNVAANLDADPVMLVARVKYALSKRTFVYVAAAYAKAKNDRLVSLSRDDVGYNDTQRGVMAGVQHRF